MPASSAPFVGDHTGVSGYTVDRKIARPFYVALVLVAVQYARSRECHGALARASSDRAPTTPAVDKSLEW